MIVMELVLLAVVSTGLIIMFFATLGVNRFDDICMRLHASSTASTGGMVALVLAVILLAGMSLVSEKK